MHLNRLKLAIKYKQKRVSNNRYCPDIQPLTLVCCSPQCPAVAGLYLVRGTARVPPEEHDPPRLGSLQDRAPLPGLLRLLHHLPLGLLLPHHEEALHQVHLQLLLLLHIPL